MIYIVLFYIIGYLFGSIPVGYLFAKSKGVDIFTVGSKNPGSTNVGRVLGKTNGRIVFFLDCFKTIIPITISILINMLFSLGFTREFIIFNTGFAAVLGHNFPIFLRFQGGKGITCTVATVFYFNPIYAMVLYLIYKTFSKLTNKASVGSLVALLFLLISSMFFCKYGFYPFDFYDRNQILVIIFLMFLLAVYRHKSNIIRIINHKENVL